MSWFSFVFLKNCPCQPVLVLARDTADSMCIKIVNICINNYSSKNCFNILLQIQWAWYFMLCNFYNHDCDRFHFPISSDDTNTWINLFSCRFSQFMWRGLLGAGKLVWCLGSFLYIWTFLWLGVPHVKKNPHSTKWEHCPCVKFKHSQILRSKI